jgi:hypothetical protein
MTHAALIRGFARPPPLTTCFVEATAALSIAFASAKMDLHESAGTDLARYRNVRTSLIEEPTSFNADAVPISTVTGSPVGHDKDAPLAIEPRMARLCRARSDERRCQENAD